MMNSCQKVSNPANSQASTEVSTSKSWQDQLTEMMPYLGHRNWIVIADMAYPLQSGSGITTLYADEPYLDVLEKVKGMIDKAPHVFAHIYRDKELSFISEKDMPGVDSLRAGMDRICGNEASSVVHEDLIARLDAAGRLVVRFCSIFLAIDVFSCSAAPNVGSSISFGANISCRSRTTGASRSMSKCSRK